MAIDGFLTRTIAQIRLHTDEPSTNAKYTDANLIRLIESSWADILGELNRGNSAPIRVRHDVDITSQVTSHANTYILPPNVGAILELAKVNTATGMMEWREVPRSFWNPAGPGFSIEGNTIIFEPHWQKGTYTLRLVYVPNGDLRLHEGTVDNSGGVAIVNDTSANTCTFIMGATPTVGELDTRPNALIGSVLRILGDAGTPTQDYVQDRIIKAHAVTTRTLTLVPALTYVPTGTAVPYEVAPFLGQGFDIAIALDVAAQIVGIEGDAKRATAIQFQYARKMRTLRLNLANTEQIVGQRFEHDTR